MLDHEADGRGRMKEQRRTHRTGRGKKLEMDGGGQKRQEKNRERNSKVRDMGARPFQPPAGGGGGGAGGRWCPHTQKENKLRRDGTGRLGELATVSQDLKPDLNLLTETWCNIHFISILYLRIYVNKPKSCKQVENRHFLTILYLRIYVKNLTN